jgi:hypothetical protein
MRDKNYKGKQKIMIEKSPNDLAAIRFVHPEGDPKSPDLISPKIVLTTQN